MGRVSNFLGITFAFILLSVLLHFKFKTKVHLNSNEVGRLTYSYHYMIFHSVMKRISTDNSAKIGDKEIERVSNTKFIGVNLDEKLTWEKHILMVKSKLAKGLGILRKARKIFPTSILKML